MAALIALVPFATVVVDHAEVLTHLTPLATEAFRPSGKLQGREALLLSRIGLNEFGEGKTPPCTELCPGTRESLCQYTITSLAAGWRAARGLRCFVADQETGCMPIRGAD